MIGWPLLETKHGIDREAEAKYFYAAWIIVSGALSKEG